MSHETVYTAIYTRPRGELRRQLIDCLRHGRSTRRPRTGGTDRRGQIPDMISTHVRPPQIDDRLMPDNGIRDYWASRAGSAPLGTPRPARGTCPT